MFHARLFASTPKFRGNHFIPLRTPLLSPSAPSASTPEYEPYLDGNPSFDRPLIVQFCANDPDDLLDAARFAAPYCDAVDLNLGCPQGIAKKGHYGAFLQEDPELIFRLINKLHLELDVPVTAKIRILETREKTLEYARLVLRAGASMLTVHGRVREQKGHRTGLADWGVLRYLREELPKETVIFANGNILRGEDVRRCLEETGADGVMAAEGCLYDPGLFAAVSSEGVAEGGREYWIGVDGKGGWRMDAVMRRYLGIIYEHVLQIPEPVRNPLYLPSDPINIDPPTALSSTDLSPSLKHARETQQAPLTANDTTAEDQLPTHPSSEPPKKKSRKINPPTNNAHPNPNKAKPKQIERSTNPNHTAMQPHLFKLLRPLVAHHHHVRDALARCRAGDIAAFEHVLQLVEGVVKEGVAEYAASEGGSWVEEEEERGRLEAMKRNARENAGKEGGGKEKEGEAEEELDESSIETVRDCRRPWWVVQPYVRPLPAEALRKGALALSKKEIAKLARDKLEQEVRVAKIEPVGK